MITVCLLQWPNISFFVVVVNIIFYFFIRVQIVDWCFVVIINFPCYMKRAKKMPFLFHYFIIVLLLMDQIMVNELFDEQIRFH